MAEVTRQVTFKINEDLYQALRYEAFLQERSLSFILVESLMQRLGSVIVPDVIKEAKPNAVKEAESFFVDPGD